MHEKSESSSVSFASAAQESFALFRSLPNGRPGTPHPREEESGLISHATVIHRMEEFGWRFSRLPRKKSFKGAQTASASASSPPQLSLIYRFSFNNKVFENFLKSPNGCHRARLCAVILPSARAASPGVTNERAQDYEKVETTRITIDRREEGK